MCLSFFLTWKNEDIYKIGTVNYYRRKEDGVLENHTFDKPSQLKPWLKEFRNQEDIKLPLPKCTLYDRLDGIIKETKISDITAINYYGYLVSYRELIENIDKYASAFASYGIKSGDYVTMITVSVPETFYMLYALNYIGAVANMIDPRTDVNHIKEFTYKANSKALIVIENIWEKVAELSKEMDLVIVQSATDSLPPLKAIAKKISTRVPSIKKSEKIILCKDFLKHGIGHKAEKAEYVGDAPVFVVRTGGTTGSSKGVVLTNDSANAVSANFTQCGMRRAAGETLLNFLPIAASYGIVCGMHMALTMGFTNILIPVFDPDDFADLVVKYKPNHIIGAPVFYEKLMNSPKTRNMDMSFLKTTAAGGDSLNATLADRLKRFCEDHNVPYPLAQGYGMSEVSSAASFCVQFMHKPASVGVPSVYTTIGIFEPDTDNELPFNEVGEVCISGPTLMKEYLGEPEETANIMRRHSDGKLWIHSGDLGRMDEDGYLFIEGRMKRTIVRFDGHKSYPIQIEAVVCHCEDVLNCCVIPVTDLDHPQGELPLIIAEVDKSKNFDEESLKCKVLEYCKDKLEERSQPISVVFVDDIPLSANGKNDFKALMKEYGAYKYK